MTSAVAVDRCRRCGTKIRKDRKVCPSCGMDLAAPPPPEPAVAPDDGTQGGHPIRKVAAKTGVKICAICMASVPDDQIVEQDGQLICPTCAENVRQKAARKGAPPPPEGAPQPRPGPPGSPPRTAPTGGRVPCPEAGSALTYAIIGLFCFGVILGSIAISKALKAKEMIKADPRLTGEGKATAALILGIIDIVGMAAQIWVGAAARHQ